MMGFQTIIRLALLAIFLTVSSSLFSQNIDSINTAIHSAQDELSNFKYQKAIDKALETLNKSKETNYRDGVINSLIIIANSYRQTAEYSTALNHYLQASSEIDKSDDKQQMYQVNFELGELYNDWGVPEKALAHYKQARVIATNDPSIDHDQTILLNRLATTYLKLDQHDMALANYQELLSIHSQNENSAQTISTLKKIASIYNQTRQFNKSLNTNLDILNIYEENKDSINTAIAYNSIGYLYKDLDNQPKALEYFNLALKLNKDIGQNGANDNSIVSNLINIGVIHQSMGDYRNSLKSFNEALKIKEKSSSPVEIAVMHNYLASIYYTTGKFEDAESHTQKAIGLLQGSENKRMLASSYKRLTDIYKRKGEYKNALQSYEQYSLIKDSLLYREQLVQERENYKQFVIETTEKESKLNIIDQEMRTLELANERVKSEKERQEIELLLRQKELQNISLKNEQLEQDRQLQQLLLQQEQIETQKKDQEIVLLEQTQNLQAIELQKNELLRKERQKEIELQNSKLELQQSQLERSKIRQTYLIWTVAMSTLILLLIVLGYFMKRRDNKVLQSQYAEINEQKERIEKINEELIELNEEKNDLISIVAHDLKSPLNQISGILDIIKLTAKDQSQEQQEYINKIDQSAQRLKRMVTKILDVSAIEAKTLNLQLEEIGVDELLKETVNQFREMADKKNITINEEYGESLSPIMADAGYTAEVFENLVSNAVKYSPLDKTIHVKLSGNNGHIRAEFIDEGQGISKEDMKKLFGKYHKLSARPTAGEDSTGLGLSIVKKYVEAMNGSVWCESEEGKGANFIVEFEAVKKS